MDKKLKVLACIEENAKYTVRNIADATGIDEPEVKKILEECEEDGTIVGYKAIINWDRTEADIATAFIEITVRPKEGEGFDEVARKIGAFPEVVSLYLMSGGFDLAVIIEGKTMKDVARFVFDKLAVIDGVTGTATHFVLNKYKDKGVSFEDEEKDTREQFLF